MHTHIHHRNESCTPLLLAQISASTEGLLEEMEKENQTGNWITNRITCVQVDNSHLPVCQCVCVRRAASRYQYTFCCCAHKFLEIVLHLVAPYGPGAKPLIPSLPHILLYLLIFPFLLASSIFLLCHPFPFYYNSPTPFQGRMS